MYWRIFISLFAFFLPWKLRRLLLCHVLGYKIHPKAFIGWSLIIPDQLEMSQGAYIGHLNICKGIHLLSMAEHSRLSTMNWVTGFPAGNFTFFAHKADRYPALFLKAHSAITSRHYLDCTETVTVGEFTTVAGIGTQILTHSINLAESKQDCKPINIGRYCFLGTKSVLLPGASLPDFCVLGALSLLNKKLDEPYMLYGGVPALPIQKLSTNLQYFQRPTGFVH